ncbi:MAG TPA: mechanosensitive ion channel domain-containing protein [Candidatus Saccharimonadales bacterium]|nr:mechanosensitive ion channel domain-containing protein [Candidatus Saccharimonadales bacterium]
MFTLLAESLSTVTEPTLHNTLDQSQSVLRRLSESFLNVRSLIILVIALTIAIALGRLIAFVLRRVTNALGKQADKTEDLTKVNRLRRSETLIILSIAIIKAFLIGLAVYFWWIAIHPKQQPTAVIGASAVLAIILGGALAPILRDLANGSVMMAEHWFGVGDHVRIDPFDNIQGIVERVTLRSTRVRGMNGEVIWINNQSISAVRVTPKGLRTIALELFTTDSQKAIELIETANTRLPSGSLMVASPLTPMVVTQVGDELWHITAIGETAPGREWLIEKYAITILQELNEELKNPVLVHEPIARFADTEAERRFARAINNARKQTFKRRLIKKPAKRAKKVRK